MYYNSNSECTASFTGRKILQWPAEVGSTCIAESYSEESIKKESVRLLSGLGFKGLGSVEFKRDKRDNLLKITEPTVGRIDLQSGMSCCSGINMPLLYYYDSLGMPLSSLNDKAKHFYWINEEYLIYRLRKKEIGLSMKKWLHLLLSSKAYQLFDWRDLKPFLWLIKDICLRFVRKLRFSLINTLN
jgi:predicted ATP-grasp superfamily ATP-dependent carboligase